MKSLYLESGISWIKNTFLFVVGYKKITANPEGWLLTVKWDDPTSMK
ncbi:MAG: hypothetical protein WC837_08505 [Bellilinea sp.]